MKRHITTITIIALLMALAGTLRSQSFQPYKSGIMAYHGYQFPIVPGSEEWKTMGYLQSVASLQLPIDTLNQISTARLLETCLYYPFNIDIFAFDDQIGSFGRVKDLFNGYAELYQRSDFVQQLIAFYNARDIEYVDQFTLDYDKGLYSFDFCVLEFMLADAARFATESQAEQIVASLLEKMDRKRWNQVYRRTNRIIISLAIGRCLQRLDACHDYQGMTLNGFLQSGKLTDLTDLDYIIDKAKSLNLLKP